MPGGRRALRALAGPALILVAAADWTLYLLRRDHVDASSSRNASTVIGPIPLPVPPVAEGSQVRPTRRSDVAGGLQRDGRGAAANSEQWERLLSEVEAIPRDRPDRHVLARRLILRLADFLTEHPMHCADALTLIVEFERRGLLYDAQILAAALGLVPDDSVAKRLLALVPAVGSPKLQGTLLRAVGQNRHGFPNDFPFSSISSELIDLSTPLSDATLVAEVVGFGTKLLERRDRDADMLLADVCAVLAMAAKKHDSALRFLLDIATDSAAPRSVRIEAFGALGLVRSPTIDAFMREQLASTADPDSSVLIARSLVCSIDPASPRRLLDRIRSAEPPPPDIRARLIGVLGSVQTSDPTVLSEVRTVLEDVLSSENHAELEGAALGSLFALCRRHRMPAALDWVIDYLGSRASLETRARLLQSMSPGRADRERVRQYHLAIVLRPREPASVRRAALRGWISSTSFAELPAAEQVLVQHGAEISAAGLADALADAKRRLDLMREVSR